MAFEDLEEHLEESFGDLRFELVLARTSGLGAQVNLKAKDYIIRTFEEEKPRVKRSDMELVRLQRIRGIPPRLSCKNELCKKGPNGTVATFPSRPGGKGRGRQKWFCSANCRHQAVYQRRKEKACAYAREYRKGKKA